MAKTLVIDLEERTRVPFLRGILTRSLQEAGIPFESAYRLSSTVRQSLADQDTVTTQRLRATVLEHLRRDYAGGVADRYEHGWHSGLTLLIRDPEGNLVPFSWEEHRRKLEACGISREESVAAIGKLYEHLMKRGTAEVSSRRLGRLTYQHLHGELGPEVARRFLVWSDHLQGERPLVILIGGSAGVGKSTVATELANRLEIVRTQSTDMLREVMRMMIPERLLPVLHTSSFTAWQRLPIRSDERNGPDALLSEGYQTQAELLSVACEAVVQRALTEGVSLILEGVHVQSGLLQRIPEQTDAIVVPIMLAVLKRGQLRERLRGRGKQVPQRRAKRYTEHLDEIWRLQAYLLSEADRLGIPIIPNEDRETVFQQVMNIIIGHLSAGFDATPKEVFL